MKGSGRIRKGWGVIRRRFKPGAVILMYHRVADLAADPYQLAVPPARFAQHLDYLKRTCTVMRLTNLIDALQANDLPKRAVAITFDDGYIDNYREAYPLLKAAGLPATIYVASGKLDNMSEFWWDDLERILGLPDRLPEQLRLCVQDTNYEWPTGTPLQREMARHQLQAIVHVLPIAQRESVLDQLCQWAGLDRNGRADYRVMSTVQLKEIASNGLIDIGGHTINHPSLAALPLEDQRTEIVCGRQMLEAIVGKSLQTFAYPYGTAEDFTADTTALVRELGFRAACTTRHGSVEAGDDLFALRRGAVFNWDATWFKNKLEGFLVARD
jgi:peptidoglycan/xylan/chitin deacetylase (PgdA/CDA1 family)